jgi:hypothetical protein
MAELNLSPAAVDVKGIRAGDRNLFQLIVRVSGQPLNLTGYTVTAQARTKADDPEHLDAVCTITDAPAGKLDVRWPGEAVRNWLAEADELSGVWDLQLSTGSTDPWTIVSGSFHAEMDITHA